MMGLGMKRIHIRTFSLLFLAGLLSTSCKDRGQTIVNGSEELQGVFRIVSFNPPNGSTNVDKLRGAQITFSHDLEEGEDEKLRFYYVGDTSTIHLYRHYSGVSEKEIFLRPLYLWKAGATVEIIVQRDLRSKDGRTLQDSAVYRFDVAANPPSFVVIGSSPGQGDTISLNGAYSVSGYIGFNDYLPVVYRPTLFRISPPAIILVGNPFFTSGSPMPQKYRWFQVFGVYPNVTYTVTVPDTLRDYEGDRLAQEYRLVFHTRP